MAALLEGGANPTQTNLSGHKPADYARSDAMRRMLDSFSNKVQLNMHIF